MYKFKTLKLLVKNLLAFFSIRKMNEKPCLLKRLFVYNNSPVEEVIEIHSKVGSKSPKVVLTSYGFYMQEDSLDLSDLIALAKREKEAHDGKRSRKGALS